MQQSVIVADGTDIARWTSPMKLFEYMAAGLPIVASDFPVIREVLCDGENALLVDPADINAWCSRLNLLVENTEHAAKLGLQAKLDLEEKYTWAARAEQVLAGL